MFLLPEYQRLTEEQKTAYDLPLEGVQLVIGPPGSGKTVVALHRSMMLNEIGKDFEMLVFNNTLNQYLGAAINHCGLTGKTCTFIRWFADWYRRTFHEEPPQIKSNSFDWPAISIKMAKNQNMLTKFPHIILDEGQDFSPDFYMVLPRLFGNATVFADENQRITEETSTIEDIQDGLGVDEVLVLTKNFRNTFEIARFAAQFYVGLPSGIPELPDRHGVLPRILMDLNWSGQMSIIARYAKNWRNKYIAVFLLTKNQIQAVYKDLCRRAPGVSIEMYLSDDYHYNRLDFTKPGIKIISYRSAKGLEFDSVFIPLLNDWRTGFTDNRKMDFYVLCSRAREDLFLLTEQHTPPNFLREIPTDYYTDRV